MNKLIETRWLDFYWRELVQNPYLFELAKSGDDNIDFLMDCIYSFSVDVEEDYNAEELLLFFEKYYSDLTRGELCEILQVNKSLTIDF